MLKKMCLLALILCGAAVFAGDRAGICLLVFGDPEATIDFVSGSPAVKLGEYERDPEKNALMRSVFVELAENAPVEIEFDAIPSASGRAMILCRGCGEKDGFVYVACSKLAVNGKRIIPTARGRGRAFYSLSPMTELFAVEAGKPVKIKATFAKISAERSAKLAAAAIKARKARREAEAKEMEAGQSKKAESDARK